VGERSLDRLSQPVTGGRRRRCGRRRRRAPEGLADHPVRRDLGAEEAGGDVGDHALLVGDRATGRHGGGRADGLEGRGLADVAEAADEECDVGALAAAVGVEFVEDEEAESLGGADEVGAFVRTGQDEFEHHVVGEQDVGWVGEDRAAFLRRLLAGVAGKGDRLTVLGVAELQELLEFMALRIGEGIHRVDDDRLDSGCAGAARRGAFAKHGVHDRHDVGE